MPPPPPEFHSIYDAYIQIIAGSIFFLAFFPSFLRFVFANDALHLAKHGIKTVLTEPFAISDSGFICLIYRIYGIKWLGNSSLDL